MVMGHNWTKLYEWDTKDIRHMLAAGIERCTCGALRLTQEDGKYSYFKPGWSSPEEPPCAERSIVDDRVQNL